MPYLDSRVLTVATTADCAHGEQLTRSFPHNQSENTTTICWQSKAGITAESQQQKKTAHTPSVLTFLFRLHRAASAASSVYRLQKTKKISKSVFSLFFPNRNGQTALTDSLRAAEPLAGFLRSTVTDSQSDMMLCAVEMESSRGRNKKKKEKWSDVLPADDITRAAYI
jgi:hypothetical protein